MSTEERIEQIEAVKRVSSEKNKTQPISRPQRATAAQNVQPTRLPKPLEIDIDDDDDEIFHRFNAKI